MLEAVSVTRAFGPVKAVDDLTLAVAPGELFCLLGANGAGKTTTINLFLGFLAPDVGTVAVGGVQPAIDPRGARKQLAYIPENVMLYPNLSGIENLEYFVTLANCSDRSAETLAATLQRA